MGIFPFLHLSFFFVLSSSVTYSVGHFDRAVYTEGECVLFKNGLLCHLPILFVIYLYCQSFTCIAYVLPVLSVIYLYYLSSTCIVCHILVLPVIHLYCVICLYCLSSACITCHLPVLPVIYLYYLSSACIICHPPVLSVIHLAFTMSFLLG